MPLFLSSVPHDDAPENMNALLRKIEKDAEYIPNTTSEFMRLEEAFSKSYVFELGVSSDAL